MTAENEDKTWSFDDWSDRYDSVVAAESHYYARYDEVLDAVVQLAGVSEGKRVLDIGTGTGNLALRCVALGAVVVGVDPSEQMLARACEKLGANSSVELRRVAEPFLRIPYPDGCFDAVVSTYAYHHLPHGSKPDSVREMLRVLRPGGSWAVGDLAFENREAEETALRENEWLEEEYFARVEDLGPVFSALGMKLNARRFTPVTWVLWAVKPALQE